MLSKRCVGHDPGCERHKVQAEPESIRFLLRGVRDEQLSAFGAGVSSRDRRTRERDPARDENDRSARGQRPGERGLAEVKGGFGVDLPVDGEFRPALLVERRGRRECASAHHHDIRCQSASNTFPGAASSVASSARTLAPAPSLANCRREASCLAAAHARHCGRRPRQFAALPLGCRRSRPGSFLRVRTYRPLASLASDALTCKTGAASRTHRRPRNFLYAARHSAAAQVAELTAQGRRSLRSTQSPLGLAGPQIGRATLDEAAAPRPAILSRVRRQILEEWRLAQWVGGHLTMASHGRARAETVEASGDGAAGEAPKFKGVCHGLPRKWSKKRHRVAERSRSGGPAIRRP